MHAPGHAANAAGMVDHGFWTPPSWGLDCRALAQECLGGLSALRSLCFGSRDAVYNRCVVDALALQVRTAGVGIALDCRALV